MPRVNRDLQRRLAARRERDRRRSSSERRYRFASAAPSLETTNGVAQPAEPAPAASPAREARPARAPATRAPAPRAFLDYRAEYAYVAGDLKRVGLVVVGLLAALGALALVLPR